MELQTSARPRGSRLLAAVLLLGCAMPAAAATYRYSHTSNRIYVEGGGDATLSEIKAALPNAPLDLVDPANAIWLLRAHLVIEDGSRLLLRHTQASHVPPGDVDELRLKSDPVPGGFVSITADHGYIQASEIVLRSWDTTANAPDTEYQTYGRAFVRARSRLAADGVTPLESHMEFLSAAVSHLGYDAPEAYGVTWKVVGDAPDLHERVKVRGLFMGGFLEHNYIGAYLSGAEGIAITDLSVRDCISHGVVVRDFSEGFALVFAAAERNGGSGVVIKDGARNALFDTVIVRDNGAASRLDRATGTVMYFSTLEDGLNLFGSAEVVTDLDLQDMTGTSRLRRMDAYSTVAVSEVWGYLADSGYEDYSEVTSSGSRMLLQAAPAGATNTLAVSGLRARTGGDAVVQADVLSWPQAQDGARRQWRVRAGDGPEPMVYYYVVDLAPATTYRLYRQGVEVGSYQSGSWGDLSFSDAAGTGETVYYELVALP